MTEKYAWYRVPGISLYVNAGKDRKVRIYCFLFCLASYLVLGTRYENDILFFCALLRTGEAVPLHTSTYAMYSYIYILILSSTTYRSVVPGGHVRPICESWKRQKRTACRGQPRLTTGRTRKSINKERHPTMP